jgi:hypothetical protein
MFIVSLSLSFVFILQDKIPVRDVLSDTPDWLETVLFALIVDRLLPVIHYPLDKDPDWNGRSPPCLHIPGECGPCCRGKWSMIMQGR